MNNEIGLPLTIFKIREEHQVAVLEMGISDSHGVTGGVYKTRERIHRDILIRDY